MTDNEPAGLTRQQIYDRIRQGTKDEYILEEMIRLGFWTSDKDTPTVPEQLIREEAELVRELNGLLEKQRKYDNRAAMLRDLRKKRLVESRKKQAENKERRERERLERTAGWKEKKEKDILYLGEEVSGGLNHRDTFGDRLSRHKLPDYKSVEELAKAMDVTVGEIRFLAYNRKVSRISHYKRFYVPKKRGGRRLISAPMPRLKNAQYFILDNILSRLPVHEAVHGFIPKHSIVTNAAPHAGRDVVVNIDLRNFFPTITYKRARGLFRSLGYSEQMATIFGLICTEPDMDEVVLDGQTWHVAGSDRRLPQGAPTSPAISNLICQKMDKRLNGAADSLGFIYTRYADDLTFSASGNEDGQLKKLLFLVNEIVTNEGFEIHPGKLRVMRKGSRREVTGIVVNGRPGINRRTLRNFRALLFQLEKDGPRGKHWNKSKTLLASIRGYAAYVAMVNPEKGKPLIARVNGILEKQGFKHVIRNKPKPKIEPENRDTASPADNPWWKFW